MSYVRFAALGDSTTAGYGDPVPGGWRGWAKFLADAIADSHDMSFCNLAVSGALVSDVAQRQLPQAVGHRPDIASLIVGVNDTMRSSWDRPRIREELLLCADTLNSSGTLLMTTRFHDHGAVFGLPSLLRRPLWRRLDFLNEVYDEVHATYGGVLVDLGDHPEILSREYWSIDRLHPSELGHRALARAFAERLHTQGLEFCPPTDVRDGGYAPSWRSDVAWMVMQGAPWFGRRARDLGPWAARMAWSEAASVNARRRRQQVSISSAA